MTNEELDKALRIKKAREKAFEKLPETKAWRRKLAWESGEMHAKWAMGLGMFAWFMTLISTVLRALGK